MSDVGSSFKFLAGRCTHRAQSVAAVGENWPAVAQNRVREQWTHERQGCPDRYGFGAKFLLQRHCDHVIEMQDYPEEASRPAACIEALDPDQACIMGGFRAPTSECRYSLAGTVRSAPIGTPKAA